MKRITVKDILEKKKAKKRITVISTYDFAFAKLVDQSEIDMILVGDSLGMVVLGHPSTLFVTMRDMLHHTKAVSRAAEHALVVADMPFGSYQTSPEQAVRNAKRFIQEAGAEAVKLEGGASVEKQVKALVKAGIPVMGHIGMTPQSVTQLGGYKVQGRSPQEGNQILKDAQCLERAGAFSIVLECVPHQLGKKITQKTKLPTIGIGAGAETDGQVLVLHDLLGFEFGHRPKFVRQYAHLDQIIRRALAQFKHDVERKTFPSRAESYE